MLSTLLYLSLCWNDAETEMINNETQFSIQRSSKWATSYSHVAALATVQLICKLQVGTEAPQT